MAARANASAWSRPAVPVATAIVLATTAGFADAFGYLQCHRFAANMTGNTVLFGIAAVTRHGPQALAVAATILAFFAGCLATRLARERLPAVHPLLVEAALLAIAACLTGDPFQIGVVAFAMGVQNTAIGTFADVKANTSFVTGDYNRLAGALVEIALDRADVRARHTIAVIAPLIVAYGCGGAVGAELVRHAVPFALAAAVPGLIVVSLITSTAERAAAEELATSSGC